MGLLYYGYDEFRVEMWLDFVMGCFLSIWGCGVGWFIMVFVDILDYFFDYYLK